MSEGGRTRGEVCPIPAAHNGIVDAIPARPLLPGEDSKVLTIPWWISPVSASICNGGGAPESLNGLGLTPGGDILLYRRLSTLDWERWPTLYGVKEVWITYRMRLGAD